LNRNPKPKSLRQLALPIGICLLPALLWPVSYFCSEGFSLAAGAWRYELTTGPGWMAFTRGAVWRLAPAAGRFENRFVWIDAAHRNSLAYTRIYSLPGDYRFYFPLWMLSMAMGLLIAGVVVSYVRQKAAYKPGCCEKCGYDLRATPERCPVCGNVLV
jgi:hypothetical protein